LNPVGEFLILFILLLPVMTVHEFAHGWVASKLGDNTARYSGRVTLNPLAHIDPFWTFLLPLLLYLSSRFFIAAAKPVPINYWSLKNPKRDTALIGASGPLANFIFAVVLSLILKILPLNQALGFVFHQLIFLNIMLGVFNLVPVPPLDGSRILIGLLPADLSAQYARIEPYGLIIVSILFITGLLGSVIWPLIQSITMFLIGSF